MIGKAEIAILKAVQDGGVATVFDNKSRETAAAARLVEAGLIQVDKAKMATKHASWAITLYKTYDCVIRIS